MKINIEGVHKMSPEEINQELARLHKAYIPLTNEEISKRSSEIWAGWDKEFNELCEKYPDVLLAGSTEVRVMPSFLNNTVHFVGADLYTLMFRFRDQISIINKSRSKKPRPKKHATNKAETMRTMRKWRVDRHTLTEFIDAAITGSIEGLRAEKDEDGLINIDWTNKHEWNGENPADYKPATLKDWWKK